MLETIISWLASALGGALDWLLSAFVSLMDLDIQNFVDTFPFFYTSYRIFQYIGIGLTVCIASVYLFKFFLGSISGIRETPGVVLMRIVMVGVAFAAGGYLLEYIIDIARLPYMAMLSQKGVSIPKFAEFSDTFSSYTWKDAAGDSGAALTFGAGAIALISLLILVVIAWNIAKLMLEVCERYVMAGVLIFIAPLVYPTLASSETQLIFKKWFQMFVGQCILMTISAWSLKLVLSGLSFTTSSTGFILKLLMTLALCKIALRADTYMKQLGVGVAHTGDNLLGDMLGVMKMLDMGGGRRASGRSTLGENGTNLSRFNGLVGGMSNATQKAFRNVSDGKPAFENFGKNFKDGFGVTKDSGFSFVTGKPGEKVAEAMKKGQDKKTENISDEMKKKAKEETQTANGKNPGKNNGRNPGRNNANSKNFNFTDKDSDIDQANPFGAPDPADNVDNAESAGSKEAGAADDAEADVAKASAEGIEGIDEASAEAGAAGADTDAADAADTVNEAENEVDMSQFAAHTGEEDSIENLEIPDIEDDADSGAYEAGAAGDAGGDDLAPANAESAGDSTDGSIFAGGIGSDDSKVNVPHWSESSAPEIKSSNAADYTKAKEAAQKMNMSMDDFISQADKQYRAGKLSPAANGKPAHLENNYTGVSYQPPTGIGSESVKPMNGPSKAIAKAINDNYLDGDGNLNDSDFRASAIATVKQRPDIAQHMIDDIGNVNGSHIDFEGDQGNAFCHSLMDNDSSLYKSAEASMPDNFNMDNATFSNVKIENNGQNGAVLTADVSDGVHSGKLSYATDPYKKQEDLAKNSFSIGARESFANSQVNHTGTPQDRWTRWKFDEKPSKNR